MAVNIDEHLLPIAAVAERHQTHIDVSIPHASHGLTAEEAQRRLARDGLNIAELPRRPSIRARLRRAKDPETLMVGGYGILAVVWWAVNTPDTWDVLVFGIWLLVLGVYLVGFVVIQDHMNLIRLERHTTSHMRRPCRVVRDGHEQTVLVTHVVVGDVVLLRAGDTVPADLRLVHTDDLSVDMSTVTGEAGAVTLSDAVTTEQDFTSARNLAFGGSHVQAGSGSGIVIRAGRQTLLGTMLAHLEPAERPKTRFHEEAHHLYFRALPAALALSLGLGIGCFAAGHTILFAVVQVLGPVMVCIAPRGLTIFMDTLLVRLLERLASLHVYIKLPDTLQLLADVDVLVTDMTELLTHNELHVQRLWMNQSVVPIHSGGIPGFQLNPAQLSPHYIAVAGAVFSDVPFAETASELHISGGSKSSAGILRLVHATTPLTPLRSMFHVVHEVPYIAARKFAAVVLQTASLPDKYIVCVKGSAEAVLARCSSFQHGETQLMRSDDLMRQHEQMLDMWGTEGFSTVGFAAAVIHGADISDLQADESLAWCSNLAHLGVAALGVLPRANAQPLVQDLQQRLSMRMVVVTSEHPSVAMRIGIELGLLPADVGHVQPTLNAMRDSRVQSLVVSGNDVEHLMQDDWAMLLRKPSLMFARFSSFHKWLLVQHLQGQGCVVAATGAGAGDGPALTTAHVGIALGGRGTDVARKAAAIIVQDDGFASIHTAIATARQLPDYVLNFVGYTQSRAIPLILPLVLAVTLGLPLGLNAIMVLLIGTFIDVFPAMSIADEPHQFAHVLEPRRPFLIPAATLVYAHVWCGIMQAACCWAAYLLAFLSHGVTLSDLLNSAYGELAAPGYVASEGLWLHWSTEEQAAREASGAWFVTLVLCQFWHSRALRPRAPLLSNRALNWSNLLQLLACGLVAFVPGVQYVTGTAQFGWASWLPQLVFLQHMLVLVWCRWHRHRRWLV